MFVQPGFAEIGNSGRFILKTEESRLRAEAGFSFEKPDKNVRLCEGQICHMRK